MNFLHDGRHCLGTVWKPHGEGPPLFRSWLAPGAEPPRPHHAVIDYRHPKVDRAYFRVQEELPALQGRDNLWVAGMYAHGVDCHESAVRSAIRVAAGIGPTTSRLRRITGG